MGLLTKKNSLNEEATYKLKYCPAIGKMYLLCALCGTGIAVRVFVQENVSSKT